MKDIEKNNAVIHFDLESGNIPYWFDGNMDNFLNKNIKLNINIEEIRKIIIDQLILQKEFIEDISEKEKENLKNNQSSLYKYLKNELSEVEMNKFLDSQVEIAINHVLDKEREIYQKLINYEIEKNNSIKGMFIKLKIKGNPLKYDYCCIETKQYLINSLNNNEDLKLLLFINELDYTFEIISKSGELFLTENFILDNVSNDV